MADDQIPEMVTVTDVRSIRAIAFSEASRSVGLGPTSPPSCGAGRPVQRPRDASRRHPSAGTVAAHRPGRGTAVAL